MNIKWNEEKNNILKENRKVSFEEMAEKILLWEYIIKDNPSKNHNWQKMFIILDSLGYPCCVPFVENDAWEIFLKTIFQNRKFKV